MPLQDIRPYNDAMIVVVAKARGLKVHLLERYSNKYEHTEVHVIFFFRYFYLRTSGKRELGKVSQ